MMKKPTNILIVGVGGQGVLLASALISEAALEAGYDAKKSEVHGMAQRGGVVSSHVRIGEKVFSPLIPMGQADVLLAFEKAEAQRWVHFIKPGGKLIVNDLKWVPPIAFLKGFSYPPDPVDIVRKRIADVRVVPAQDIAKSLGNFRAANLVLVGAVSQHLDIPESVWEKVVARRVPKGTEALNWRAFLEGRK
jgi:indolepyruvate ferredoxin oxidoreductase, beta subunit